MKHGIEEIKNACKILGLSMFETRKGVEKKYKELIKQKHPDVNKKSEATAETAEINKAYAVINDYFDDYVFSFGKTEFGRYNPHDADMERMKHDTTWGV
ncbi:MAG: DnaJ domain-containing protein [Candidatus Goldbacteria bacterium]|nr:DnaJ domain-containing protein [Candidatus Goldiibacteriota bacterium]